MAVQVENSRWRLDPDQIDEGLFLSCAATEASLPLLQKYGITHVVQVRRSGLPLRFVSHAARFGSPSAAPSPHASPSPIKPPPQVGPELVPSHPSSLTYLNLPILDKPYADLVGNAPAACRFIDAAVNAGSFHC